MATNPAIFQAIEQLDYRVTVGDVAAKAGLDLNTAQQGLLALATDAGGHLQVAESGDVAYSFPKNFRTILRNKSWQIRLQETWQQVWKVLFYLIRISFGILLILSITLILIAIGIILISLSGDRDEGGGGNRRGGGGFFFIPRFFFFPDFYWLFNPNYHNTPTYLRRDQNTSKPREMNFFEAIFSFLFGDGNPNADLEERRWQEIGRIIRNNKGAVVAEQIAPYLDSIDQDEDYMLGVLTRFNGYPEVSPTGEIIYYFPELQVSAKKRSDSLVADYLHEYPWRFSRATSGQILMAIGLGAANIIGALVLGTMLTPEIAAQLGGLVAFVNSIYWLLLAYGIGFLGIPLVRYFWIQRRNPKIEARNNMRRDRAQTLHHATPELQHKIAYAQQFAEQKVLTEQDVIYTTETDVLDQDLNRADQIDEEWRKRLEG
jgi:hypothetical protein